MAEYLNKEVFLASMGLTGDETKYGNRDAEHQHRSYSTYMSYEIMDCVDDSIVDEELIPKRHGKWEKAKYIEAPVYVCSECGNREPLPRKFCPECGAMMEAC